MRLFRRALLCFVVGVAAFGVAGWGFRPRPSWSVVLDGAGDRPRLATRSSGAAPVDAPVWVVLDVDFDRDTGRYATVESRDPRTGKLIGLASAAAESSPEPLEDGRLFALKYKSPTVAPPQTLIRIYDAVGGEPVRSISLPGKWITAPGNRGVWRISANTIDVGEPSSGPYRPTATVSTLDLLADEPAKSWTISDWGVQTEDSVALSPDLKLLAVGERTERRRTTSCIEIIDLENKSRRVQIPPPRQPEGRRRPSSAGNLRFSNDGRHLRFVWSDNQRQYSADDVWLYDLKDQSLRTDDYRPQQGPPFGEIGEWMFRSSEATEAVVWMATHDDWIARRDEEHKSWYVINQVGKPLGQWRRVPMQLSDAQMAPSELVDFLPGPNTGAWIVTSTELPLATALPSSLAQFVPEDWREEERRTRWFDVASDRWIDFGPKTYVEFAEVRPHALLVISHDASGNAILQSWPLPPRDPKWPALGVAALCAAGTWWVGARRYRRETHRANIATVTS